MIAPDHLYSISNCLCCKVFPILVFFYFLLLSISVCLYTLQISLALCPAFGLVEHSCQKMFLTRLSNNITIPFHLSIRSIVCPKRVCCQKLRNESNDTHILRVSECMSERSCVGWQRGCIRKLNNYIFFSTCFYDLLPIWLYNIICIIVVF